MATNQTVPTAQSVQAFLAGIADDQQRADSRELVKLMQSASGLPPQMWGPTIIGFGKVHYKYASGREGDMMLVGFSPRKQNLALYGLSGSDDFETLLAKLGKYKRGKGCLYINHLADVDLRTLKTIVQRALAHHRKTKLG